MIFIDRARFLALSLIFYSSFDGADSMTKSMSNRQSGFSVLELMVVIGIILVLSAISIPFYFSYTQLYKSEDEALKIMDHMREAGQLALSKRRTFRLELDLTSNEIHIIDENGANPDRLLKSIPLESTLDVRIDQPPTGVTKPNPPNFPDAVFATDALGHLDGTTTVIGHKVWAARFRSDGSVVSATNAPVNTNIYIWPPTSAGAATTRNKIEVRCLSMYGGSGAVRYWKHNNTTFVPY